MDDLQNLFGPVLDLSDAYYSAYAAKTPTTETELQTKDILTHLADGAVNVLRSPRIVETKTPNADVTPDFFKTFGMDPDYAFMNMWDEADLLSRAAFVSLLGQLLIGDKDSSRFITLLPQYTPATAGATVPGATEEQSRARAGSPPRSGVSSSNGSSGAGTDHAHSPAAEHGAGSAEQARRTTNIHIVGIEHEQPGHTNSSSDGVAWWNPAFASGVFEGGTDDQDHDCQDHTLFHSTHTAAFPLVQKHGDMEGDSGSSGDDDEGGDDPWDAWTHGHTLCDFVGFFGYGSEVTRAVAEEALMCLLIAPNGQTGTEGRQPLPPFPHTTAEAARMQADAQAALRSGQVYKAAPLLSMLALRSMLVHGPEHADTVRAVYEASKGMCYSDTLFRVLLHYLLPRAAAHWGGESPELRLLVQRAARWLASISDARRETTLTQITTEAALQLQGGLGWGTSKVVPLADEDVYNRHVVLEHQADRALDDDRKDSKELARKMYQRCVAYYDTLGPHWLGSQRKVHCMIHIACCMVSQQGGRAAESYMSEVRHTAQEELGLFHDMTLRVQNLYALLLQALRRNEKAYALRSKALQKRITVYGPFDELVLSSQVAIASLLHDMGRNGECKALLERVYLDARHALGPDNAVAKECVDTYHKLFEKWLGTTRRTTMGGAMM